MVSTQEAYNLLVDSISDLEKRNGYLSPDDYAADIINVTCKYFIDKKFSYRKGPDAMSLFPENYMKFRNDAESFIGSISGRYPRIVTEQNIRNMAQNVCLNIGWNGMSSFLNDYFYKKHGKNEGLKSEHFEFASSFHVRYENGILASKSDADRQISLTFTNDRKNMTVRITPSLSLKEARLENRIDSHLVYRGVDPDYRFDVIFDEWGDVGGFSLELASRRLKLDYFE